MTITICDVCGEKIPDGNEWNLEVMMYNSADINNDATKDSVELCAKCAADLQQILESEYSVKFNYNIGTDAIMKAAENKKVMAFWLKDEEGEYRCSSCGRGAGYYEMSGEQLLSKFCPECGMLMEMEEHNDKTD